MKGAMAEPLAKMINEPNKSRVRIIGKSQYFLRVLKKPHKSRKIPMLNPSAKYHQLLIRINQILRENLTLARHEHRTRVLFPLLQL